jgi:hypothetical protein
VSQQAARRLGRAAIAGIWIAAAYLLVYYSVLLTFGPDRLHRALGESTYNALIPAGGFILIARVMVHAAVWLIPFGLTYLGVGMVLSRMASSLHAARRRWIGAVAGAAALLGLAVVPLDGWPWVLMPLLGGDDTEFASAYSPIGFWMIRRGMTPDEVVRWAGEPLEHHSTPSGGEDWRWSRSPHSSDYRLRVVVFSGGRVEEKYAEFYFD